MFAAVTESRGKDLVGAQIRNHLRFLRVPLLFTAIVAALSFFGRSIGCSVASTNTISMAVSLAHSFFLPGK